MKHLHDHQLLYMDRLKIPVAEIVIPELDEQSKNKAFDELFKVKVNMVEDGKETEAYMIHE